MSPVRSRSTRSAASGQFHVLPDPGRLMAYRLGFCDVRTALAGNSANVGAGYIERNGEQCLVRSPGQVGSVSEIQDIVIGARGANPVRVRDVAEVIEGRDPAHRRGNPRWRGDRARYRCRRRKTCSCAVPNTSTPSRHRQPPPRCQCCWRHRDRERRCGLADGQRVHPEPRRGRRRAGCDPHSRHQPYPVALELQKVLKNASDRFRR
jgi:hypothetical protein